MRAKTCCTVSLKGETVLLRRSHIRKRCAQEPQIQPNSTRFLSVVIVNMYIPDHIDIDSFTCHLSKRQLHRTTNAAHLNCCLGCGRRGQSSNAVGQHRVGGDTNETLHSNTRSTACHIILRDVQAQCSCVGKVVLKILQLFDKQHLLSA